MLESELTVTLDRAPTSDEILEEYSNINFNNTGHIAKIKDLRLAMDASNNVSPLDIPSIDGDSESFSPIDIINGDPDGTDCDIINKSNASLITKFINTLGPRDRDIVLMYNGFTTEGEGMSYKEIATRFECSTERIRQRYKASIRKLTSRIKGANISLDTFF